MFNKKDMVQRSYENHDVFGNSEETWELCNNMLLFEQYLKTIKYNMYESTCKNIKIVEML